MRTIVKSSASSPTSRRGAVQRDGVPAEPDPLRPSQPLWPPSSPVPPRTPQQSPPNSRLYCGTPLHPLTEPGAWPVRGVRRPSACALAGREPGSRELVQWLAQKCLSWIKSRQAGAKVRASIGASAGGDDAGRAGEQGNDTFNPKPRGRYLRLLSIWTQNNGLTDGPIPSVWGRRESYTLNY